LAEIGPSGLVLIAALMHAIWNALIKASDDRLMSLAAMKVPTMVIGALLLLARGLPTAESIPFAMASACAFAGYAFFLLRGYGAADLNFVYPIARGMAPVLVAVSSGLVLGEWLSTQEAAAFAVVCAGLLLLGSGKLDRGSLGAVGSALAVSGFIAIYTVLDGIGARLSADALAYTALANLLSGIPLLAFVYARRGRGLNAHLRRHWLAASCGGSLMFLAYALVIVAMTLAPLARVAALRETSVVFAALIGALILKERAGLRRILASLIVALAIFALLIAEGS
jgi:drug/metabolite transporter (DMT)-like permease